MRVIASDVYGVAVDLSKSSSTFGQLVCFVYLAENKPMTRIPPGLAHDICVRSVSAVFLCETMDYWSPEFEGSLLSNDPVLKIELPLMAGPPLAAMDAAGQTLSHCEVFS